MSEGSVKRIDFHIHTKASEKEPSFTFSMDSLLKYVEKEKLSAIAITNHNLFDYKQFQQICNKINIPVFPGIEIDLEGGHILIIAPQNNLDNFKIECSKIEEHFTSSKKTLDFEKFVSIFAKLSNYLVIPHYKKFPEITSETIEKLKRYIVCGEVSSSKKWFSCYKNEYSLTPVLFSDYRAEERKENDKKEEKYPSTLTYVKCDELNIPNLITSLKDKTKVHINSDYIDEEFQILYDGTTASNNLNIIMGLRSSGKTYTLDSINASFKDSYIKYIRQFDIVKKASDSAFNDFVKNVKNDIIEDALSDIKDLTNQIINIDLQSEDKLLDDYLITLKEYADNSDKKDEYAKSKLFNCESFVIESSKELDSLIQGVRLIIDNIKYKSIIDSKIGRNSLVGLLNDLLFIRKQEQINAYVLTNTNDILKNIKIEFDEKSTLTSIADFDILSVASNSYTINKFNSFIKEYRKKKIIKEEDSYRFKIKNTRLPFAGITEVKNFASLPSGSYVDVFKDYYNENPYQYIIGLKNYGLEPSKLYKTLVKIDFEVLNKYDGSSISGGEQAEYVLYEELSDANKYDIVLIDEPESSFDNVFLKKTIIDKIKNLSNKTTVFLVTHNSTLGLLMNPDKIIFTQKAKDGQYKVFTGSLTSKEFSSIEGEKIGSYNSLMDVMESGEESYFRKRGLYENIRNS